MKNNKDIIEKIKNIKFKTWFVFLCVVVVCILTFCNGQIEMQESKQQITEKTFKEKDLKQENSIEKVDVHIPNLKNTYTFVWVSDLHIIQEDLDVAEEYVEVVKDREDNMFITPNGIKAADIWKSLATYINDTEADAVLLGGDMIDYASESNCKCLADGLKEIEQPILYAREDHDYAGWYSESLEKEDIKKL